MIFGLRKSSFTTGGREGGTLWYLFREKGIEGKGSG